MKKQDFQDLYDEGLSIYEIESIYHSAKKTNSSFKPVKPILNTQHTPEEVVEYSEKLKQYLEDLEFYNETTSELRGYNESIKREYDEFLREYSEISLLSELHQKEVCNFNIDYFSYNSDLEYYENIKSIVQFVKRIIHLKH